MEIKQFLINALELGTNILKFPRRFRWTKAQQELIENLPPEDVYSQYVNTIPGIDDQMNFRVEVIRFLKHLRGLQEILQQAGFKPTIMHLTDLFEHLDGKKSNFVFGLMYPQDSVKSYGFAENLATSFPDYYLGLTNSENAIKLDSSIDAYLSIFGAATVIESTKIHLSDYTNYVFLVLYIGPRTQIDVDREVDKQHINVDPQVLEAVWGDLNLAYSHLDHGIVSDLGSDDADAAGVEA